MINRFLLDEELMQEFGSMEQGIIYKNRNKRMRGLLNEISEGFCSNDLWYFNNDPNLLFVENFRRVELEPYTEHYSMCSIVFKCLFESNEKNSIVFEKEGYKKGSTFIYRDFFPSENKVYIFFVKKFLLRAKKDQHELCLLRSDLDHLGFVGENKTGFIINFNLNVGEILNDWYFWDEMSEKFRVCVERHINCNEMVEW